VQPEDAVAKYNLYLKQSAEQQLESFKTTELFYDLYHPLAALRRYDLRIHLTHKSADAFLRDMQQNRFDGCCWRAPAAGIVRGSTKCTLAGHLQAPHFAVDPDVDSLLIHIVPHNASVWNIFDVLTDCSGLLSVAWTHPAAHDMSREMRARFASPAEARAALNALAVLQLNHGITLRPVLVSPSPELVALVAPPEMSHPDRIRKDEAISARIVRHLDSLFGIKPEITQALLGAVGSPEAKLDLQLLYLQRVHHFCFYAATWGKDEWDLKNTCEVAMVRMHVDCAQQAPAEGAWARLHEKRLEAFLASAQLDRPSMPLMQTEKASEKMSEACSANIDKLEEGKFTCKLCGKLFKGPEFVEKHIRKVHLDIFHPIYEEANQQAAYEAYTADPRKPNMDCLPLLS